MVLGFVALLLAAGICIAIATSAFASCSGTSCLPGSGYTLDSQWDCGTIDSTSGDACYANGTLAWGNAVTHTWGWGSADYDGAGSTWVCIQAEGGSFGSCGTNLARACFNTNCNDQSSSSFRLYVENYDGGTRHTVYGHGKA
jgi:hypothetical protein